MDKVPATGDPLGIWLMLFAISLTGLAGMLARRKKN
ncbi:MAG: LPXTG cell wall anchor domain-containing protein [Waltera sp.]